MTTSVRCAELLDRRDEDRVRLLLDRTNGILDVLVKMLCNGTRRDAMMMSSMSD